MSSQEVAATLPGLCRSLLQAGFGLALQSTLLLGLGLLAGRALHRRGPALASLIYRAALAGTLLGVLLSAVLGRFFPPLCRVSLPLPTPGSVRDVRPAIRQGPGALAAAAAYNPADLGLPAAREALAGLGSSGQGQGPMAPGGGALRRSVTGASVNSSRPRPEAAHPSEAGRLGWVYVGIVGVWGAGALALFFWLLLCQIHLFRLRRNSPPAQQGSAALFLQGLCAQFHVRPPLLLVSSPVRTPFLAGVWRPAIFLPAGYEREFDGPALRAILAHELVHMARRDCAWNLLARIACAIGWIQPLLWALCRCLEQASEELCDLEVVHREGNARAYADCLLRLSETLLPSPRVHALGVGVVPFRSSLGRRIQRIIESSRQGTQPLSARLRTLVFLSAAAVVVLGVFLVSAVAAPVPEGPDRRPAGEAHQRPALEGVRELEKPVTYTETKIPLGELVQKVGADTGVKLAAAADVADEPVAVVVKDLPARELLEQLAELLDYRWMRVRVRESGSREGTSTSRTLEPDARTSAFEIYQDAAGKRAEAALREAAMAGAWQRLGEQIPRYVQMAARPPAEIERLLGEEKRWVDRLFQLPYVQRLAMDVRDRALRKQFQMAEQLASPVARCEVALLGHLTPPQWALLRQGRPLVFSTEPQAGEIPLPDEIARAFHAARPDMGDGMHYGPEHEEQERQRQRNMEAEWAKATGYEVRIALDASRFESDGELSLKAASIPLHGGQSQGPAAFLHTGGTALYLSSGPWDADEPDEKASAVRRAALEKDRIFGAKKPLKVDLKPHRPEEPYWKGASGLGEMLPDVARVYGVSLISDAYQGDRTTARFSSEQPIALHDLLDRLAGDRHVWDHHGRLVRFRYRAWPFARPQEVPLRLLHRWQELLDRDGALPLEEWLSVATLNDLQLDTLFHWAMFRGPGAFVVPVDPRYALRLYISLTPGQQQALRQGRPLPFARMTLAQQELFLGTLREQAQTRQGILVPGSEPAIGPQAALSLSSERQVWIFEQHGDSTRIHYESAPETTGAAPAAAPRSPAPARSSITRRTITTMKFRFQSGLGSEESVPLYTSSPP